MKTIKIAGHNIQELNGVKQGQYKNVLVLTGEYDNTVFSRDFHDADTLKSRGLHTYDETIEITTDDKLYPYVIKENGSYKRIMLTDAYFSPERQEFVRHILKFDSTNSYKRVALLDTGNYVIDDSAKYGSDLHIISPVYYVQ